MKKLMIVFVMAAMLVACGKNAENKEQGSSDSVVRVGMVTNSGSINDKSFNEGTWNGIVRFSSERDDVEAQHLQPTNMITTEFITNAEDLITSGNEILLLPSFIFEEAVAVLQEQHPDIKFVILDGAPEEMADNTVAIFFAEEQAGFLAGVAAALESQTGKVGFIGGIEIPPVQRFGWGFLAGVAYANLNLDVDVEVAAYQYQGTFDDVQAGMTLAGGMYDMGIDIIFSAAGAVGNGVISEAQARVSAGENVFVIGVDIDQFEEGLMPDGHSVILTSAIKRVDNAAYDMLEMFLDGEFPGGQVLTKDASTEGVGLPEENPNLSAETQATVSEVLERIKVEEVVVPRTKEGLEAWLEEVGFDMGGIRF